MNGRQRLRTPSLRTSLPAPHSIDRERHEHLGWLLGRVDRLFAEGVTRSMAARGYADVRLVHIALIRNVDETGTRISEIARRAGMTKQATGQLVSEFVELGYVNVVSDAADRRVKVARYTPKGRRLLRAIVAAITETETAFAAAIGARDLAKLKSTLSRVLLSEERLTHR